MNAKQLERMRCGKGFIAALDQSGGSTPKALRQYGLDESNYSNDEEMFDLVHQMRTRIMTSPSFSGDRILAAILFENTMEREIEGRLTADYLWEVKGILPILKVDKGLLPEEDGVQLMKPIPGLDALLAKARDERHIFGTKMRSVIKQADPAGIRKIADQQFEIGQQIAAAGLVPILEPEVDIHCPDKAKAEELLHAEICGYLKALPEDILLMFKLTLPEQADLYADIMEDPRVVRVVALSGGYSLEEADARLAANHGMIASFSRALLGGLRAQQDQETFDRILAETAEDVYRASLT